MNERHDTVVIGGGQAGLAMSYYLREHGREHIVLERKRVAERWRGERWDSLCFQFPNWALRLPGFPYRGDKPDEFAHHSEITRFIDDYARFIEAPIRSGVAAAWLREAPGSNGYLIGTGDSTMAAANVVIATGPFQRPSIPACAAGLPPDLYQVHASVYRRPGQLAPGAVLVVGSGASGCQIAEELHQDGRAVYLCVSRHRRVPRRYRGKDVTWWLIELGGLDRRIDSFADRRYPPSTVVTGVGGGHDVDVRNYAADGVVLLGSLIGAADGKIFLKDNAEEILAEADKACADFIRAADDHARAANIDGLTGPDARSGLSATPVRSSTVVNLKSANINSIVWGTGYGHDYDWLKVPVLDQAGAPVQQRGVTACANLYFLGLHWMHTFKSGLLFGVGADAAYLADQMNANP